ncbi:polyphosphate kinase 1 [Rhodanobacter sp. AS-Z3]|uniref:polyphosphate kinase 1 n=1 Tax=Rhodanobacter sp. AS-Z3 TaxID=3031330 RepID=UPI002479AA70|nr:polyphosphate kinase 1 [Rhodanobacter sp. AS-Z3]WEN16249.1 polyphosphate kinase 1 [Rhodanobacter sp. AS-Z3]
MNSALAPQAGAAEPSDPDFRAPELYLNHELSTLEFNFRVLAQANSTSVPLLERLQFLCISVRNLDEFFEVRVASLRHLIAYGDARPGADGLPLSEVLAQVRKSVIRLVHMQYETWNDSLRPALAAEGIVFSDSKQWSPAQRCWAREHFVREILPVLSPLGLNSAHPFPRILNKSLNVAVVLNGSDAFGREGNVAVVRAPRSLPRVIRMPQGVADVPCQFVFLSTLLEEFADAMFPDMEIHGAYQFRVTRDSELELEDDDTENLARVLSLELRERGYAEAVRLELGADCTPAIRQMLLVNFGLKDTDAYLCGGPVNLHRAAAIYDMVDRPDLKYPPLVPAVAPTFAAHARLFETLSQGDVLLHHPFESFMPVLELLRKSSTDPDVLAIRQTLYRVGEDSPLIGYLVDAARSGKEVTVVIELRARFDEEANIRLADRLQEAGVQVVYGVVGYKTHAKMLLIVRRERGVLRHYAHLSTGNYHQATSRLYTDIGLITQDASICEDVSKIFQQLCSLGPVVELQQLLQSPFSLHQGLLALVAREIEHAQAGKPARIVARMNALNEPSMIEALYRASCAGVKIDLIVRGACMLRPGLPGISERIRVRSVLGRFLEHSRVYWFANGGEAKLYCSSADWMERNLLRRVEACFPVRDARLATRIFRETLQNYLDDNLQAWLLDADGHYHRATPGDAPVHSAQQWLLDQYEA